MFFYFIPLNMNPVPLKNDKNVYEIISRDEQESFLRFILYVLNFLIFFFFIPWMSPNWFKLKSSQSSMSRIIFLFFSECKFLCVFDYSPQKSFILLSLVQFESIDWRMWRCQWWLWENYVSRRLAFNFLFNRKRITIKFVPKKNLFVHNTFYYYYFSVLSMSKIQILWKNYSFQNARHTCIL